MNDGCRSARILSLRHSASRSAVTEEAELLDRCPIRTTPSGATFSCGGAPSAWPVEPKCSTVQYVTGRIGERYICQSAEDAYALCVGPFCMDSLHDKELNRHAEDLRFASVKDREAVRVAIHSLKRLSEDSFFYTGQLLQLLCNAFASANAAAAQPLAARDPHFRRTRCTGIRRTFWNARSPSASPTRMKKTR